MSRQAWQEILTFPNTAVNAFVNQYFVDAEQIEQLVFTGRLDLPEVTGGRPSPRVRFCDIMSHQLVFAIWHWSFLVSENETSDELFLCQRMRETSETI